jgi:TPR repeat protein
MLTERRQILRAKPYEPVYVSLANQNRGIVIDASEDGLQFRADAPVEHEQGMLSLRFTFNPLSEIETVGEIVWMDESKRTVGLRFNSLPEAKRSDLRKWLEQSARLLPPRADVAGEQNVSTEAEAPREIESELAPWRPSAGARFSQPDNPRYGVRRTVFKVMLWLVFVVISGVALVFFWRVGGRTQSLGQDLYNWISFGSQSNARSSTEAAEISPLLRHPSKTHRIPPIVVGGDAALPSNADAGAAELSIALQYLRAGGRQADSQVAVKWLWAAVEKGNTKAAMLLADLYAWGRGVPQNCDQARVLLIAASKRGSNATDARHGGRGLR